MSNTDERVAAARRQLAEAQAGMDQAIAAVRASLIVVEEENRQLRREALERQAKFYTEAEFAAVVKVGESTIERLRLKKGLLHTRVGGQVRYTDAHLAQFGDQKSEVRRQKSDVMGPRRIRA